MKNYPINVLLFYIAISFLPVITFAQDAKIVDSLKTLIITGKVDTLKAKHMNDLVWYIKFSNPDTSLILLDQSETLSEKLDFADGLGNSFNNRAIIYTVSGDFKDALKYYKLAIGQFERNKDIKGIGFCLSNMAICYKYQSLFDSALVFNQKALAFRQKYDLQKGVAQSNINIGVIYFNKGFYRLALQHYLAVLNFYENKPEKTTIDKSYLGSVQNNIGNTYFELSEPDKARRYFKDAMVSYEDAADSREKAYLNNDLGDTEQLDGNFAIAKKYYLDALELARQSDDKLIEVAVLSGLSSNYLKTGSLNDARTYAQKGLKDPATATERYRKQNPLKRERNPGRHTFREKPVDHFNHHWHVDDFGHFVSDDCPIPPEE